MADIEFTHLTNRPEHFGLDGFGSEARHKTRLRQMEWQRGWTDILTIANQKAGADVSEIGNTWLASLVGMNALRAFRPNEISRLGGVDSFLPAAWRANSVYGQDEIYAIPWHTTVRIIAYRRDIFAQLGISEVGAFATADAMINTLASLQSAGIEIPWAMNTAGLHFHGVAPWIWGAGGHYRSSDRHHLNLDSSETCQGIINYLKMGRFLSPAARNLDYWPSAGLLASGKAAAAVVESSFIHTLSDHPEVAPDLLENLGFTKVPGVPYVGCVSLIIWGHTLQEESALDLIQYLVDPETQRYFYEHSGNMPTRMEAFDESGFFNHELFQACYESLQLGRSFMSTPFWAVVESRFDKLIQRFWQNLFNNPDYDLGSEVPRHLHILNERLEKTLFSETSDA